MVFLQDIKEVIFMIPILLFSIALHESSHARAAYLLGDKSQLLQGRMTLDPFVHLDIFGFISILLIGIGWGKPAFIDSRYFKNKTRDTMLVSLAGPLSNLLIAFILTLVLKILLITGAYAFLYTNSIGIVVLRMISLAVVFNVILCVFNLLPIPPFDGSKVLAYFLPENIRIKYLAFERYSIFLIVILFVLNIDSFIITPIVGKILELLNIILNL